MLYPLAPRTTHKHTNVSSTRKTPSDKAFSIMASQKNKAAFVSAGCSFTSQLLHRLLTIALCYPKLRDHYAVTFADHQLNGPVRRIVWVSAVHKS